MKKIDLTSALANYSDCKIAFANDAKALANVATDVCIKNISDDDATNIHPLYVGNCTLNKKSVLNAANKLNIANVSVCSTNGKKHYLTIAFDDVTMYFTPDTYTINANNDNALATAKALANMFYYTK